MIQEPEGFRTRGVDSAILHANDDLIPGRWDFSLKTVGGGAGDSNHFFRFVWLNAGGSTRCPLGRDVPRHTTYL